MRSASASTVVPILSSSGVWDFDIEGRPEPAPGQPAWNAVFVAARPGFLETIGARIVRGRAIEAGDDGKTPPVVVINETLAARFFGAENPLGRRLRVASEDAPMPWMRVVGVVADMHDQALDEPSQPMYIAPHAQAPVTADWVARGLTIAVRTDAAPDGVLPAIRAAVRELDPELPVYGVQTYDAVIAGSLGRPRFVTTLLGLFAFAGLVLGASGLYGVLAYTVARRAREIGIRRALGATPGSLVRLVVTQGMAPVAAGLAVGLLASVWTARLLASLLYETSPNDPATLVGVTAGVIVAALAACAVPTRRVLAVSPMVALRGE